MEIKVNNFRKEEQKLQWKKMQLSLNKNGKIYNYFCLQEFRKVPDKKKYFPLFEKAKKENKNKSRWRKNQNLGRG